MDAVILVLSCLLCTVTSSAGDCGSRPHTRIVGGHEAAVNSWPWQVQLRSTNGFPFCGGSLIDPYWVVSATHCLKNLFGSTKPSEVKIRLGAHFRTTGTVGTEQDIDVAEIYRHEKYHSPQTYSHDIALLKLAKPAKLGKGVGLVCLPDSNLPLPIDNSNKKCWITGWGRLASGGASPTKLMRVDVPLVSKTRCLKAYPGKIHDSMLCAGLDQGGVDACQGDSGGPLVCEYNGKWQLEGVTSWGYGCAAPGRFGVYANVRYLSSWVRSKISGGVTPKPTPAPTPPKPTQAPTPPKPTTTAPSGNCGSRPHTRIVGGHEAAVNSWPWQVQLRSTYGFPFCGGSLIDPYWVVSATHCLTNSNPSQVKIRLGAHFRTTGTVGTEQDIDVAEIYRHEKYHSPQTYSHDIALLKLAKPAKLGKGVGLVCLPDSNLPLPIDNSNKKCWITGWGRLASGGASPTKLMQVDVPLVSKTRCLKAYPGKIHDSMLCAGLDQGGVDACQGDSGGPLVCEYNGKWQLEGVTSWGYGCAAPGRFGVYANVRYLSSWVRSKISGGVTPKPTPAPTPPKPTQVPTPPKPTTIAPSGNCGSRPHTRIVGGHEAAVNSWPWQVQLRSTYGFPFCGGSLIDPYWVVSATHCLTNSNPSQVKIRLGAHFRTTGTVGTEQDIDVAEIYRHEKYHSPQTYSHDIALLKLAKPAKLGKGVGLVCLPDSNLPLPIDNSNKKCWITGWGRLASGGASPTKLMQVDVPLVSKTRCLKAYPGKIHDSMLCAGLDQGGVDACQGDSGGPLVCEYNGKWQLEGVTSWGYGCAAPGRFGVYANVRYLSSWVRSKISGGVTPKPTPAPTPPKPTQVPTPPKPTTIAPSGNCGSRPHTRIVGGHEAAVNSWPWQVQLRSTYGFPFCGGSLIDPYWVVSATHCLTNSNPSQVKIRLGAHFRTTGTVGTEQDFDVAEIYRHEKYHSPQTYSHDIALLKLAKPAKLGKGVGLVCLPDSNLPLPIDNSNKKCWITGWGRLASGGASPTKLMQVDVPLVSKTRCLKAYPGKIHDSMLCAGLDQGGVDACQGDSGGPLVCEYNGKWQLEGVTSWGYGCAAPGRFGVYANVRYLSSWVRSKISGGVTPKPTPAPTPPKPTQVPTPPKPTTIAPSGCKDSEWYADQCPTLAQYPGYCQYHHEWTKKYCAKSCGWCSPGPSTPPPPTSPPSSCGRSPVTRVIGGVDAKPGNWPWQIALLRGSSKSFSCGGSLIAPDWVVTAAHCISRGQPASYYTVRLGDHNRYLSEGTEQDIPAKQVIVHPQYSSFTIDKDIALIQLSKPATLNGRVNTVCLPAQDEMVSTSAKCFITGWGKIQHPGSSHNILQQAEIPPVTNSVCQKKLDASPGGSSLKITPHMLCAGKSGTILSGCHGDSGGPYVCQGANGNWVLQGDVSWGSSRCSAAERYTVFGRVAKFRNWIDQTMKS